jgi:hypothetical protein
MRTQNPGWPQVVHRLWLTDDPNDPAVDWSTAPYVDCSEFVEDWTCYQERGYELDTFQPGKWSGTLDNSDGRWATTNTAGPHYGLLLPRRRLQTLAVWQGIPYEVATVYADGFPQQWSKTRGQVPLSGDDPLGVLAKSRAMQAAYTEEILGDDPLAYYPLTEPADAQTFVSLVGNWPAARIVPSKYGSAVVASGVDGLLGVEPGTAVEFSGANGVAKVGSVIQLAANGLGPYVINQAGTGIAFECWFQALAPVTDPGLLITQVAATGDGGVNEDGTITLNTNGTLTVHGSAAATTPASPRYDDGQPHHVVFTVLPDGVTHQLYVDGALVATNTGGAFDSSIPGPGWTQVGGLLTSGAQQQFLGTGAAVRVQHVALYQHEITAAQALAHYQAGASAFTGETSGARAARILRYSKWNGATDIDTGVATMGPLVGLEGQRALAAFQDAAQAEAGEARAGRAGEVVFRQRTARYNLPLSATFGERADLGELRYLRDLATDNDDTYVFDEVRLSRPGGGTISRTDDASGIRFFHATFERALNVETDTQLESMANYWLSVYKDPHDRVPRLTIKPSVNPALWPVALGLQIGQRVRVTRRPFGAPPFTVDVIVEGVRHQVTPNEWTTTFTLSPADITQYWQLGVAGFSELGVTTRLAP